MAELTHLKFDRVPSMGRSLLKAGLARKKAFSPEVGIPPIEASVSNVVPDKEHVAAFFAVCGQPAGDVLPPTYPHLLATPLHMQMIAHPTFPLKGLGLVHVRQTIDEHRPIAIGAPVDVTCAVSGFRWVKRGVEFDLMTHLAVDGDSVWEATTTALSMIKRPDTIEPIRPTSLIPTLEGPDRSTVWRLSADLGRRYAEVAGDRNPIHLYAWSAKLFGFKRPIIHGMWSLARALAEASDDLPNAPRRTEVQFKRPLFLPGSALFESEAKNGAVAFVGSLTNQGKVCFGGHVQTL